MAKVNEVMKKTTSCRFQTSSFLPFFLPSLAESGDDLCVIRRLRLAFMERVLSDSSYYHRSSKKEKKSMMLKLHVNELCLAFKHPIRSSVRTLHHDFVI
jgi:hypothetical protein